MEINEQPKWYVVHTYSGYENSVETDLRNMIENNSLQDYIFDIKIPVEDDVVERNGKKKVVQRKKFPSYDQSARSYEFRRRSRSSDSAHG